MSEPKISYDKASEKYIFELTDTSGHQKYTFDDPKTNEEYVVYITYYAVYFAPGNKEPVIYTMNDYFNRKIWSSQTKNSSRNLLRIMRRIEFLEDLLDSFNENCYGIDLKTSGLSTDSIKSLIDKLTAEGVVANQMIDLTSYKKTGHTLKDLLIDIYEFLDRMSGNKNIKVIRKEPTPSFIGIGYYSLPLLIGESSQQMLFDIIIEPYVERLHAIIQECRDKNKKENLLRKVMYAPNSRFSNKAVHEAEDILRKHFDDK